MKPLTLPPLISSTNHQQKKKMVMSPPLSSPPRSRTIVPGAVQSSTPITSNTGTGTGIQHHSNSTGTTIPSSNVVVIGNTNKRLYRTAVTTITKATLGGTTGNVSTNSVSNTNSNGSETPSFTGNTPAPATSTSTSATTTTTTTTTKWVTRDIASLEFLLHIPLAAERDIVTQGYQLQIQREMDYYHSHHPSSESSSSSSSSTSSHGDEEQGRKKVISFRPDTTTTTTKARLHAIPSSAKGTWWEKWIVPSSSTIPNDTLRNNNNNNNGGTNTNNNSDAGELEQPTEADRSLWSLGPENHPKPIQTTTTTKVIPGRRLDGDQAIRIQIPVTTISNRLMQGNVVKPPPTPPLLPPPPNNSNNSHHHHHHHNHNNNNNSTHNINNSSISSSSSTTTLLTKQTSIARQAALREWEIATAFGTRPTNATMGHQPPMLEGRLFFSANSSYPISVFSIIRYEPRKEEAAFRRRKLEAIGGGGSQFVLPNRDWRGISYRALLRRSGDDKKTTKKFNRFVRSDSNDGDEKNNDNIGSHHKTKSNNNDDDSSTSSDSSSSSEDSYTPGLLDDPGMVLGRHRNVMIGDRVTGPIVSSTIQFVKPAVLKAELNKQFRERFDGWEPPKSARKYIGAKVIQGNYVLIDPTEEFDEQSYVGRRPRQGSVTSMSNNSDGGAKEYTIRMPPSLTLSKIRSVKRQALNAAVKANLEIGTVALACVYFERLCLDCRVDKSNRRVTFAACLLLAAKLNEPNVVLVMEREKKKRGRANKASSTNDEKQTRFQSTIRPNKRSDNMFESLLLFFTQDWNLSLKHLFTVEWGVFAALNFSLDASPSQIAFHFKRLMKTLEWNVLNYLGSTMYNQWQDALADEEERRLKRERRRDASRKNNEDRIRSFRFQFKNEPSRGTGTVDTDSENENLNRSAGRGNNVDDNKGAKISTNNILDSSLSTDAPPKSPAKSKTSAISVTDHANRRIKLFNRFSLGRSASTEYLESTSAAAALLQRANARASIAVKSTEHESILPLHTSPSMPNFIRSSSSLIPRADDEVPKLSNNVSTEHHGMMAMDVPDFIELDDEPRTDDLEQGHTYDGNGIRTQNAGIHHNDDNNDDDEGINV